jgi:hypothetical protein
MDSVNGVGGTLPAQIVWLGVIAPEVSAGGVTGVSVSAS